MHGNMDPRRVHLGRIGPAEKKRHLGDVPPRGHQTAESEIPKSKERAIAKRPAANVAKRPAASAARLRALPTPAAEDSEALPGRVLGPAPAADSEEAPPGEGPLAAPAADEALPGEAPAPVGGAAAPDAGAGPLGADDPEGRPKSYGCKKCRNAKFGCIRCRPWAAAGKFGHMRDGRSGMAHYYPAASDSD